MKLRSQKVIGCPFDDDESEYSSSSWSVSTASSNCRLRPSKGTTIQFKESNDSLMKKSYQHQIPELRRAGSSTLSTASLEEEDDYDESTILSDTIPEITSAGGVFYRTILTQFEAVFMNFYWNGLPWDGYQCRSAKAGLTGVFFALPMLFCQQNRYEQAWWILQAITSVLADYFYIHTLSAWHGVDRIVAQLSLLGLVVRGFFFLKLWAICALVSLPVSCFALATQAKDQGDISRWHWCHCLWHIFAPIGCMVGVYLAYNCPHGTVEYIDEFCLPPSESTAAAASWFGI